jgi:hypothetical protein
MTTMGLSVLPWPRALARYVAASAALHLLWEIVQLPLYMLWITDPLRQQAFAVLHCTAGDVLIACLSLLAAWAVLGRPYWPNAGSRLIWLVIVLLGVGYTIYSEWVNVSVRGSWAYSERMPIVPMIIGTGLAPLLQWFVVPTLALWLAVDRAPWTDANPNEP